MSSNNVLRIRIDGTAGSGKTSLMNRVAALLRRDGIAVRTFETEINRGKKRLVEMPTSNDDSPPLPADREVLIVCCEGVDE